MRKDKKPIFIIEHLEPKIWKWCELEYGHISKIVGRDRLWFTNVKAEGEKLKGLGKVFKDSVKDMGLDRVCVLDGEAKEELIAGDVKKYDYFVFGGILGDYPPRKRTKKELTQFLPGAGVRNIGRRQFPTDNAVFVVKEILGGKRMSDFKFVRGFRLKINEIESVELPFRYVKVNGKPLISEGVVRYLKNKKGF